MKRVTLHRDPPMPAINSVFGKLSTGSFECYTVENLELSIPPGVYRFYWRKDSPAHGQVYEAENVPGRTNIQIHSANWAFQLLGCIAPGRAIVELGLVVGGSQLGVSSSHDALAGLVADLGKLPFDMEVI